MKAAFLDFGTLAAGELDLSPMTGRLPELECYDHTDPGDVAGRIDGVEVLFVNKVALDAAHLNGAGRLRYIGIAATGTDNVDLEAARDRGIVVTNVRGYCTGSVVDYVLGALITLGHSIDRYRRDVRDGRWQTAKTFCLLDHPIRELSAMTLGIVGYGELGRAVAEAASALGMRVLVAERKGARRCRNGRVTFAAMLTDADAVSLHCPLTDATERLIGQAELEAMGEDAMLVNTARGGLVDSNALVSMLSEGRIGGAAIDVLATEPPTDGDPLLEYRGANLILTPHIAWASATSRQNAIDQLGSNVGAWLEGKAQNRV